MGGGKKEGRNRGTTAVGALGKSLVRDRFNRRPPTADQRDEGGFIHTAILDDGQDWGRLNSVTEQGNLEEFLATAELAGTEFTAEKLNVTFVTGSQNSAIVSEEKAKAIRAAEEEFRVALRVPRRPAWTQDMPVDLLHQLEKESFLEWRRGLVELQEHEHLTLTPFEKNLEVWRQLWRVVERSHVIIQIVDARNPLLFHCEDLNNYVKEVHPEKHNLLLINKADMLTEHQRRVWAEHLQAKNITFVFWSAEQEKKRLEEEAAAAEEAEHLASIYAETAAQILDEQSRIVKPTKKTPHVAAVAPVDIPEDIAVESEDGLQELIAAVGEQTLRDQDAAAQNDEEDDADDAEGGDDSGAVDDAEDEHETDLTGQPSTPFKAAIRDSRELWDIVTRDELFAMVRELCPPLDDLKRGISGGWTPKMPTIGLVGYPNVGKSSTINALCGLKKVAVSATPGKTKHFQTIVLDDLCLCDCPGLVFPSFVTTKADMVCSGMLPIDQLREIVGPITLVAHHIPRSILEKVYGITIIRPSEDDDPNRAPTAHELLNAYGYMRGYMTSHGAPDAPRSARYILKDYVSGRLLYCHPPPHLNGKEFNAPTYAALMDAPIESFLEKESVVGERKRITNKDSLFVKDMGGTKHKPTYKNEVDEDFFRKQKEIKAISLGAHGRRAYVRTSIPTLAAGSNLLLPTEAQMSKKHNNKNKKEKIRRVAQATGIGANA